MQYLQRFKKENILNKSCLVAEQKKEASILDGKEDELSEDESLENIPSLVPILPDQEPWQAPPPNEPIFIPVQVPNEAPPAYVWPENPIVHQPIAHQPIAHQETKFPSEEQEVSFSEYKMVRFQELCDRLRSFQFRERRDFLLKKFIDEKPQDETRHALVAGFMSALSHVDALETIARKHKKLQIFNKIIISFNNEQRFNNMGFTRSTCASTGVSVNVFNKHPDVDRIIFIKSGTEDIKILEIVNHSVEGVVVKKEVRVDQSICYVSVGDRYISKKKVQSNDIAIAIEKCLINDFGGLNFSKKTMLLGSVAGTIRDTYHFYKCAEDNSSINMMDRACEEVFRGKVLAKYFIQTWSPDEKSFYMSAKDESWFETVAVKLHTDRLTRHIQGADCVSVAILGKVFGQVFYGKPLEEPRVTTHEFGLNDPNLLYNINDPGKDISFGQTTYLHFKNIDNVNAFGEVIQNTLYPIIVFKSGFVILLNKVPELLDLLINFKWEY